MQNGSSPKTFLDWIEIGIVAGIVAGIGVALILYINRKLTTAGRIFLERRKRSKARPANLKRWKVSETGDAEHLTGDKSGQPIPGGGWEINPKEAQGKGVYGPYIELPPGKYRAIFRLKINGIGDNACLGTIDVTSDSANTHLRQRRLFTSDFRKANKPQDFHLDFKLPEKAVGVEFRLRTEEKCLTNRKLVLDYVELKSAQSVWQRVVILLVVIALLIVVYLFTRKTFGGVEMVFVPSGCFMMGSSDISDAPPNKQCIDSFWIDKFEVTNEQFASLGGTSSSSNDWNGPKRPHESITWFEASAFCQKRGARLPTEAEWEYAARGPDNLEYPWGNIFDDDRGVYKANSNSHAADVGSKPDGKSWVDAMDMAGNVWEWTSTIYDQTDFPYPYNASDKRESSTNTTSFRVVRGGSWLNSSSYLRSATRAAVNPYKGEVGDGFRCAHP